MGDANAVAAQEGDTKKKSHGILQRIETGKYGGTISSKREGGSKKTKAGS